MKLAIVDNHFTPQAHITKPLTDQEVLAWSMKYFDKDGFEINHLEQVYYKNSNIDISQEHLFHIANHVDWIVDTEKSDMGCVVDHSMISTRWAFDGEAKEQLIRLSEQKPTLNKLLAIRPKWGIDFSLDYVYPGGCMELFHIEADYWTYEEAVEGKLKAEELIMNTDWTTQAMRVQQKKHSWEHLNADDQADWKAQFFGWDRAFDNYKVFS